MEGSAGRLQEAVDTYKQALLERTRERVPLDWATTMNNLASALLWLGRMEGSVSILEEAVGTYQQALIEYTQDRAPMDWVGTMDNLNQAQEALNDMGKKLESQEKDNPITLQEEPIQHDDDAEELTTSQ
ncbi:hypothetical protein SDC9_157994 [bioreactor metagenome]|uniref:Tetratricopeptide repeat protein n=2 Tax=root TaxID=1 RepID=A0A645F8Z6_9ZZZZ